MSHSPNEVMANTPEQTREAWDRLASGYSEFVTPSHMWLAARALERAQARPGIRLLDVAAGSGAFSIPAARLGAQVLATDLSPAMLEQLRNRSRAEGLSRLETRVMDGNALDLEDDSFDLTGSQFGVMLFPDMPRGIREMARVTRPGGRVVVVAYGEPSKIEFFSFMVAAIRTVAPDFTGPPSDPPPLPFQLQDPRRLRQELTNAGLRDIRVETITERLEFQSGQHLWDWLTNSNPIVGLVLDELNLTRQQISAVRQELDRMIQERSGGKGPAVLTNPINIGVGTK